jgi:hypothetical protein
VHSLLLPMVMSCSHEHSLDACARHSIDAVKFIVDPIELLLSGTLHVPAKRHLPARPIKSA